MTQRKYFGTDGIRGKVGEAPITADFMLRLGAAIGRALAREGARTVLIGKDTRISGYMFESALEAGLTASGINVQLLGPMPTPAIAHLTRTFDNAAGECNCPGPVNAYGTGRVAPQWSSGGVARRRAVLPARSSRAAPHGGH